MKSQFATVEAILSLALGVATMASASAMLNSYNANSNLAYRQMLASAEIYDITSDAYSNSSLYSCIVSAMRGNSTCMQGYISYYNSVYGNPGTAFVVGSATIGNAAEPYEIGCIPIKGLEACIEVGT
ncbi:MAG: hypothetical protein ACP5K9_01525 [Candidatus Micrarchaeia archaeon]